MFDSDLDEAITEASTKTIEKMYDTETLSMPNLLLKLKLKLLLKLKLNPTTISTPELRLNVKNVMKN